MSGGDLLLVEAQFSIVSRELWVVILWHERVVCYSHRKIVLLVMGLQLYSSIPSNFPHDQDSSSPIMSIIPVINTMFHEGRYLIIILNCCSCKTDSDFGVD